MICAWGVRSYYVILTYIVDSHLVFLIIATRHIELFSPKNSNTALSILVPNKSPGTVSSIAPNNLVWGKRSIIAITAVWLQMLHDHPVWSTWLRHIPTGGMGTRTRSIWRVVHTPIRSTDGIIHIVGHGWVVVIPGDIIAATPSWTTPSTIHNENLE